MLSNFGSNSTVSFRFGSLPFKCHLIFLFYLPFSFSSYFSLLLFHPLLTSHFHFSHLVASLFSLLFALGCILATAILIKKGWEGPSVLPRLPVFPAVTGGSKLCTYHNGIRYSDTFLPTLPFSSISTDNERAFHIKTFLRNCFTMSWMLSFSEKLLISPDVNRKV